MFSLAHAETAGNIPLLFVKHEWNAETNQLAVESNPDIITEARRQFKPADTILVMCRSGDRGAMAVNALLKSWFCKRLQPHRWDGRGHGGRSHMQTLRKTDEERLEELRFALDV
jgi:rhodanese-related sulfurtransferase